MPKIIICCLSHVKLLCVLFFFLTQSEARYL